MKARTIVSICLLAGAAAWAQTTPPSQQVVQDTKAQAQPSKAPAHATKPASSAAAKAAAKPAVKPAGAAANAAPKPAVKPAVQPQAAKAAVPAAASKPTSPQSHSTKTALSGAPAATAKPAPPTAAAKPTSPQSHSTKTALSGAPAPKAAASQPRARKPALGGAPTKKPAATKAMLKTATAAEPMVKQEPQRASTANKRDPFVSPIREAGVTGPMCTTGKKCLAIDTVDLKGIVRSQNGMIAVVESSVRRVTYFLRENDPVFNGYVVKITPDSIVFRENVMDKLGKQSTRDVVKRVVAPAV